MATNSFGLDSAYFADKLGLVLRDLGSFKPEELARALARMARTACEEVLGEAEFSGLPKTVDLPSGKAYIGWMTDAEHARMVEGLDEIGALSRHLRNGGCDNTDLQGLEDGLTHAIDIANELLGTLAAHAAPAPAAQEPEDALTPPEVLASRMIDVWVEAHGRKIPWAHAVQIIGTITKLPREEVDRLLAMDDTAPPAAEQPDTDCEWCAGTGHLPTDEPCAHCAVKVPRQLLNELRAFTLEYDSGRAGGLRGGIDAALRALLGKEGE